MPLGCEPTRVLVVLTTTNGNTGRMAHSIADGVASVQGTSLTIKDADEADIADGRACDCLILGSPVRHLGETARRLNKDNRK